MFMHKYQKLTKILHTDGLNHNINKIVGIHNDLMIFADNVTPSMLSQVHCVNPQLFLNLFE